MNAKKISRFLFGFIAIFLTQSLIAQNESYNSSQIISNPMNVSYRFQFKDPSRRETADPVIEYYKGKYYLFASHSSGYWSSPDLKDWTYLPCKTIETINEFAPAILITDDAVYFMATGKARIYKNANPDIDQWEELNHKCDLEIGDPAFFKDEDGRIYLYWGLSNSAPVRGVEVDFNDGFRRIGNPVDLIIHDDKKKGWEVPGVNNGQTDKAGWNEGPTVIKVDGLYYLQYASPGTEFDIYGNSCYVSTSPLGPYSCMPDNPFSIKPRGFIASAGHGHTFRDKYGNFWHVASMLVGVREAYERRLGLFPTFFDKDGYMHSRTVFTDYPFILPDKKVDFAVEDLSTGVNLLSRNKTVKSSSSKNDFEASKASDENIKTWWAASSGNVGEWLQMDLGDPKKVNAIQVAFADEGFKSYRDDANIPVYRYTVSYSTDGSNWLPLIDRSQNTKDQIYEMIMLDNPVYARYIKVENKGKLDVGNFSIADLRVFGSAESQIPGDVTGFEVTRNTNDYRRISFKWNALPEAGTGYVLRWGSQPDRINNAVVIYNDNAEFGFFHKNQSYYFTIQAFNESGKGKISKAIFCDGQLYVPSFASFDFTQKVKNITSSLPEGTDLSVLTDKNPETSIDVPFTADTWFTFEMPAAFEPTGYAIIVKDPKGKNNPLSWKLQSSRNGKSNWTDIDTKTDQSFANADFNVFKVSSNANMYFRLFVQANNEGSNLHITGFQLFGHYSTPETSLMNTGGTITAEFEGTGSPWFETIDKVVDRSFSTRYCANGHTTGWIQYELPTPAKVDRYAITSFDGPPRNPKSWTLSGSPDGRRWETLDTRNDEDFLVNFSTMEYNIEVPKEYKFYRLNIIKNNGNDNFFELGEWQLFASNPSSIGKQTANSSVFIYPNPPINTFSIHSEQQPESVEIMNTEGKIIKSFTRKANNSYSVNDIPAGLYFAVIKTDEYHVVKFVK